MIVYKCSTIKNKDMNTLLRNFLAILFLVMASMYTHAADDLITQQITIKLDKAGMLPDQISNTKKYLITNLKVVGEINGTDLRLIRDMAGCDYKWHYTSGKLSTLDLSEAKIVEGGDWYFNDYNNRKYYTSENCLGEDAFRGCSALTSMTIPSSVTKIGDYAFSGCGLTSITIPTSVTTIGDFAFSDCYGLTNLTIPSSVTTIGDGAFCFCSRLTSLDIPSSVTTIGSSAFQGCSALTNLTIPSSVTEISNQVFCGCSALTSITIPSSVTEIGDEAFSVCSRLTSLTIPSSAKTIGQGAFMTCSGLSSVYVSWQAPIFANNIFEGINKSICTLYVPRGTYQNYSVAVVWRYFDNIVEYDATSINSVTTSAGTKEVSRFSINGQRLSAPTKGVNIVKYSDGSVKKVTVK